MRKGMLESPPPPSEACDARRSSEEGAACRRGRAHGRALGHHRRFPIQNDPAMDMSLPRPPHSFLPPTARRAVLRATAWAFFCGAVLVLGAGRPAQAQAPAAGTARAAAPTPSDAAGPRIQTLTKCTGANGRVTYSDSACPAGSRGAALQVEPDSNVVATTPLPAVVPSPSTFESRPPPAPPVAPQPYRAPPPNAGMPARQAADCALLDRRAADLGGRALQPQAGDNPRLLPDEQRSVDDLRQHLGCE